MIPEKVTVTPTSGQLDSTVNITVESYSGRGSYPPRELFCYTADDTAHDMIEIEQVGKQEFIEVYEPLSHFVDALGETISIEGKSNSMGLYVKGGTSDLTYRLYVNGSLINGWNGGFIPGDPGADNEYSYKIEVTVSENRSDSSRNWNLYITNGISINTGYIVVNQAAGVKTYDNVIIDSFTYSPNLVSAAGGTSSPSLTYHQNWGWNGATDNGGVITSGASVSYSGTNVNTSTGVITVPSKGTVVSNVTTASTPVVTVVLNGKTATSTCTVEQEKNIIVSGSFTEISPTFRYDMIPASGGTSAPVLVGSSSYDRSWTYSSGAVYSDEGTCPTGYTWSFKGSEYSIASNRNGFTINSAGSVTAPSRGTTIGNQWSSDVISVTETATLTPAAGYEYANVVVQSYTITSTCSQEKNVPVSIVVNQDYPGLVYSPSTISASGGVSEGYTDTKYDLTYTSGETLTAIHANFTDPEGVTPTRSQSYTVRQSSAGAEIDLTPNIEVTWENRGTVTGEARSVIVRRSYTIKVTISSTYGGGTLSASSYCDATSTQSANIVSYGDITISGTPSVSDIPASGGSRNSATGLTASQLVSYSSGSSTTQNVSMTYTTVTASSLGTTLKTRTQVGTMVATASANGKTATKSIPIYQARNTITSHTVDFRFSYPKTTLSTEGETVNRTLEDSGYNVTFSSGSTANERSGVANLSPSYSETYAMTASTGWSINASTGAVSVSALPQGSPSRVSGTISGVNTVTLRDDVNNVTLSNNKTYAYGTLIQIGNAVVSTQLIIMAAGDPASGWVDPDLWDSIPAKHSYLYIYGIRRYTYTDGTTRDEAEDNLTVADGLNSNVTWVSGWQNGGYRVDNRGTEIGNARTGELWWVSNGLESNHLSFTQVGNYITGITPVTTVTYPKNVSASGGEATPVRGTTYTLTFSSGNTSTTAPTNTYGTLTTTYSYSGSEASGFSAPNNSTGVIVVSNRGTTTGNARNSGTVTQTATVKFVHSSAYSAGGTVTGTATDTDYATQVANAVTDTEYQNYSVSITANETVLPASGGNALLSWGASRQVRYKYTSGSYSSWTTQSLTPTISGSAEGFTRNGGTVNAANRGIVMGDARSVTYTASYDSYSDSVTISQNKNIIVSCSFTDKGAIAYNMIPAEGGSSPMKKMGTGYYDMIWTYSSGDSYNGRTTCPTGYTWRFDNPTYSLASNLNGFTIDTSNGTISAPSRGTVIGDKWNSDIITFSETVVLTPASGYEYAEVISRRNSSTTTCPQEENVIVSSDITYGNWNISISLNRYNTSESPCPAGGGTATVTSSAYRTRTQNNTYTSGSISQEVLSNETGTPSLTISGEGASLSGNTVTWENRTYYLGNIRQAIVTATLSTITQSVITYQQENDYEKSNQSYLKYYRVGDTDWVLYEGGVIEIPATHLSGDSLWVEFAFVVYAVFTSGYSGRLHNDIPDDISNEICGDFGYAWWAEYEEPQAEDIYFDDYFLEDINEEWTQVVNFVIPYNTTPAALSIQFRVEDMNINDISWAGLQAGVPYTLTVSPETLTLNSSGDAQTVEITSNDSWTIT